MVATKLRSFRLSFDIKDRVIVKRFLDKNVVVKAAGIPYYRTLFQPLAQNGFSAPITKPISRVGWAGTFVVNVIRGRHLYNTATLGTQDVYVTFSTERFKRPICQTPRTSDGGINPLFNHIVAFRTSSEDQVLTVSVYSRGTMQDSVVGKFKISISLLITYLNPIAAGLFGESTNDILINRDKSRNSLRRSVSVVPSIQGRTTFEDHLNRMVGCGSYSVKSWFTLSRNLSSTDQYAGELLLDFRFFPNPMSKIIDWNTISRVGLSDHVVRSGKRLFGLSLGQAIKHSEYVVPAPIVDCIEFLLEFGLDEEGLFRVPGDAKGIADYRLKYDRHEPVYISEVHEAAGVLKLYFRELPDSLIPRRMFNAFIGVEKDGVALEEKLNKYRYLLTILPRENSIILHYLMFVTKSS